MCWIIITMFSLAFAFLMWALVSVNPAEDNYEDQARSIREYEIKHSKKKG